MNAMDSKKEAAKNAENRKSERGAALVTVMMISFLMLVAVGGLLLETSMNAANVTDATSEEQAYYAAESGIQSVIDALRHNPVPSPLIDPTKTPIPPDPTADPANVIDYRKAVDLWTSNKTCSKSGSTITCTDPLDNVARLSRWIRYSDVYPDRVVLGSSYSPLNGFAYSVQVSDPDNTDGLIIYTVTGGIDDGAGNYTPSRNFGSTTISYQAPAQQTINASTGPGSGIIGSFRMTGTGADIPGIDSSPDQLPRFKIVISFSKPQNTTLVVRGYIVPPNAASPLKNETGTCPRPVLSYLFDSEAYIAGGSRTTLTGTSPAAPAAGCIVEETKDNSTRRGPYGTYLTGFLFQSAGADVDQTLNVSMTRPEPTRLLIRSTGYGPKGARKELETIIQKNYFGGLGSPASLTLIGPPCTRVSATPPCVNGPASPSSTDFNFAPGNSSPVIYSGKDKQLRVFVPPIGLTNDTNVLAVKNLVRTFNGYVYGNVENIASELPYWLQNPANLDDTVKALKEAADSSGSYWGPTSSPPNSGVYGDWNTATGITFVDRDVTISQDGGGILVVTGTLTFKGTFRFNGLVLITGKYGKYDRTGGGGQQGILAGSMIVAPYDPDWSVNTCMKDSNVTNKLNCYLSPSYSISGGGSSDLMFNSQNVTNGLSGLGNFVKGVAEK